MFERYTDDAKATIGLAREFALKTGGSQIDTAHLLYALTETNGQLLEACLGPEAAGRLKERIGQNRDQPASESILKSEPSISNPVKRVLAYAGTAAEELQDKKIRGGHLLLGLMREEKSVASNLLYAEGTNYRKLREAVGQFYMRAAEQTLALSSQKDSASLSSPRTTVADMIIMPDPVGAQIVRAANAAAAREGRAFGLQDLEDAIKAYKETPAPGRPLSLSPAPASLADPKP